jgi:lipid A ethanolaminephosphotransferase
MSSGRAHPWRILLVVSLWLAIGPNLGLYQMFARSPEAGSGLALWSFIGLGLLLCFSLIWLYLNIGAWVFRGRLLKYWLAANCLLAAAVGYFSFFLGILFDKTMFLNMLSTHPGEATELLSWKLMAWLLGMGVLPAAYVFRQFSRPIAPFQTPALRPFWYRLLSGSLVLLLPLALSALVIYPQLNRFSTAARNKTISFHALAPLNVVAAALSHYRQAWAQQIPYQTVGADARLIGTSPRLVVLVLGETARAQNQQLNGYARPTNARMSEAQAVYFADTQACGTSTAYSVPCIFSDLGNAGFDLNKAKRRDNLLDVVARAGVKVQWLDNDGGCKGVCDRVETIDLTNSSDAKHCPEAGVCLDSILLEGLYARLQSLQGRALVVIHVKGSHGPAYYKRYPKEFERFKPACQTSELSACALDEIRNAYDNSLVYTDHILGEIIGLLQRLDREGGASAQSSKPSPAASASALLYVSDHGESLGEAGLFLHGLPLALAPKEQTLVPMMAWFSPRFKAQNTWTDDCVRKASQPGKAHDHVYSTVLGLLGVDTSAYRPTLDLFKLPCVP